MHHEVNDELQAKELFQISCSLQLQRVTLHQVHGASGATAACATVPGDRDWPALSAAAARAVAQVLCRGCQQHVPLSFRQHSSLQISLILLSQTNVLVCVKAWDYPIPTSFHTLWKQLRANSWKASVYKQDVPSTRRLHFISRGLNWKKIKRIIISSC